jgi:hypothetical protein
MLAMAVTWLALVFWVFRRLRIRHPATYDAIGSPSLFWNNSIRNNWLFAKFLFQGTWKALGDRQLFVVARVMQFLFIAYFVVFIGLFVALNIFGVNQRA